MRGHPESPLPAAAPAPPTASPRSMVTRLVGVAAAVTLAVFGATVAATGAAADGAESVPPTSSQRDSASDTIPDSTDDGVSSTDTAPEDSTPAAEGEPVPPDGLGDDPDLDALAGECFAGDLLACDHLFLESPVDSAYEDYGDTCGGRQEAGTGEWCELGVGDIGSGTPGTGEPVVPDDLGDDPALDQLADDCYRGDMQACDDLYWDSAIGSAYEDYGNTCGGRVPEGVFNCVELDDPVPGTGDVPVDTGAVPVDTDDVPVDTDDVPVDTGGVPVDGVPAPTVEPTGLGTDPRLDALAQGCYDGSMVACDDLYDASESGSAYQEYGDTCAGRQPTGTGRYCVSSFPGGTSDTIPGDSVPHDTSPHDTVAPDTSDAASTTVFVPPPPTSAGSGPSLPPLPSVPVSTVPAVPVPSAAPGTQTVPPLPGATTAPGVVPTPTDAPVTTVATVPGTIPPATIEPTGLGADPMLDALAQGCFDGDMESCDQLWRDAEPGSDYRDYGDTCAGRQESGTARWCVAAFPGTPGTTVPPTPGPVETATVPAIPTSPTSPIPEPTLEPTGLGADPTLDGLAQACYDGDMGSCDRLFDAAPFNSPYQQYADTCAGRQPPGTFKYCVAAFPVPD